jgi:GTPase Era involved in 16S rRNA processing
MNELNLQKSISKSDIQNISNELLNIYKSIYQDVLNITYLKDYLNSNDRIVIDETLSVMKNEFDLITEKLSDTRLYVGVTGEFSSGKSTFLNALLEHDVLETDVIQGTTCAPTIIEYSKNPNVLVKFSDGTEVSLTDKDYLTKLNTLLYEKLNKLRLGFVSRLFYKSSVLSDEVVKKYITTFAASEDVSKNVTSVTWSYPLDVLSDGLVVIDTPGIGTSANKRHTEVAEAVSKNCDALIVLFDLNKPLSSELIDNVKTVTNGDPSNCIFIGTKADTIRKREIDRLISYCQNKLNKSLNKDVNFFAISPYAANEERIKSASSKSDNEYGLSQFQEFRHKLLQILLRNRGIIQSKKLNKQITSFVTKMQSMLKNDVRHFQDQISEYNKNIIPTNSPQWEQWHRQAEFDFKSYSKEIRLSMEAGVNELVGKLKKDLYDSIDSCSDHEGLKKFLENGVQQTVSGYESKFSDYINSKVYV